MITAMDRDHWCIAWQQLKLVAVKAKAVLLKAARWSPGAVITVSFWGRLGGATEKVWKVVQERVGDDMANLGFWVAQEGRPYPDFVSTAQLVVIYWRNLQPCTDQAADDEFRMADRRFICK